MCSLTRTRAIAHDGNAGCSGCDGRVVGSQTHRGIGTIASLHTIDALRADDAGAAWPSARAVLLSRTRPEDRRIDHGNGESRVPAQVCFRPGFYTRILSTPSGSHPVQQCCRIAESKRKCRGNIHAFHFHFKISIFTPLKPPRIGSGEWRSEGRGMEISSMMWHV